MGEETERRCQGMTEFVGVREVMHLLRCDKSYAYEVLHELASREPGERGMLRVSKQELERFLLRRFRQTPSTRTRVEPRTLGTRQKDLVGQAFSSPPRGPLRPNECVYVSPLIPEVKSKKKT